MWWVIKLQLKTSKLYFAWNAFYSIYDGVDSVLLIYIGAKFISSVTDVAIKGSNPREVYKWLILSLILQILSLLLRNMQRIFEKRFQQTMELTVNQLMINKIYDLSQEQFENEVFNTKLALARDSVLSMWRIFSEISFATSSVIRFIGSIGAIVVVAPVIGLVIIITVIPVSLLKMKQNRAYESAYKKSEPYDRVAYRSRWMLIDPSSMSEIRLMNGFKYLLNTWRTNLKKSQDITFATDKKMIKIDLFTDIFEPLVAFVANLYFLRLLIAGGIGLDRFIFVRGLLDQAGNSATSIATSFERLHEMSINLRNFNEVYETPPAIPNGKMRAQRPLSIEFKNVSFAYPGTDVLVLEDISFVIVPGSKLALVGENGAGKSTLLKLLLRQYLPTKGQITINGIDIKDIEQESYYAALSNLSQDFLIVSHLTIKDNLLMGISDDVSDKEVSEITDMVGASSFIHKLPHKLDQRLDTSFDDGTVLSGGQMQRLGVARALLCGGDIMILDEPTSAIDAKAEYMIFNNIYKAHAHKTTLIVSHRFSTVRRAEKIIVMEDGKITEYGSHEELLKHGKLYKEMFEAQAEGYK